MVKPVGRQCADESAPSSAPVTNCGVSCQLGMVVTTAMEGHGGPMPTAPDTSDEAQTLDRRHALARAVEAAITAVSQQMRPEATAALAAVSQAWSAIASALKQESCSCSKTMQAQLAAAIEDRAAIRARVQDLVRDLEGDSDDAADWVLARLKQVLEPWRP